MTYPKGYIDDLCRKVDIVRVVRTFMPLRTRGEGNDEHVGLCPFIPEETPSFVVHSTKQIYHCFGCGRHGGVIMFLMKHQKMRYQEAVHWLAKRARFYPKQWRAWKKRQAKEDAEYQKNEAEKHQK